MKSLHTFAITDWEQAISDDIKNQALQALENGKVVFFPTLPFSLNQQEQIFLDPAIVDPKVKNISYDIRNDRLAGTLCTGNQAAMLKEMIKRYALTSRQFLDKLIPCYSSSLYQAKTSFRSVEIEGRKAPSYRKDDTLLHVDSFPSNPTKGERILRVFTNVHPEGKPRVWRVGEPFADVVKKIAPHVSAPIWGIPQLLKLLGITKSFRTPYDHYMLQIHNRMKGDANYQKTVPQEEVQFPAGSSWMVYTDQVSHAAMSGQHVFEQTFHLPANAINNSSTAPLKVLEKYFNKKLI